MSGSYPHRVDCEQAVTVFPSDRVLVSGRWRAPYHFDFVAEPDFDPTELTLGERHPTAPLCLRRMSGSVPGDLMGTTFATVNLVSDRLVAVLRSVAQTGWSLFPAELRLRGDQPLTGYHGLSITGRTGPIKDDLALDTMLPPLVPGGEAVAGTRGWCFEPETWDGSDVFTPEGSAAFCVTEPVADVLRVSELTGLRLERMSDIQMIKY
jgi:hypothetical protein